MNRKAFLLGFFATGSQVLLLRELVSSLNGSEIFIGTALFGWLIWVSLGAYIGGRTAMHIKPESLFILGVIFLPLSIVLTRLAPLAATGIVGEMIPFGAASLISILVVLPPGFVSGWLFPAITRQGEAPVESIVTVYLWEGLGAFAAGIFIAVLAGGMLPTLGMSFIIAAVVLAGAFLTRPSSQAIRVLAAVVGLVALVFAFAVAPAPDMRIDAFKYRSYRLIKSFDTHYGHQAILSRDSTVVLLTDNTIEANYPDLEGAENLLIPPLIYHPDAKRVLVFGRPECGVAQLAAGFPTLELVAVDPRRQLDSPLDSIFGRFQRLTRIDTDPVKFSRANQETSPFDIIILDVGELSNYRSSRLLTGEFLQSLVPRMSTDGVLFVPTRYDSDRYITDESARLLSIINNVLRSSFRYVAAWPGNTTLFFASNGSGLELPYDSISARIASLTYRPQYISDNYLPDRLSVFKQDRLREAMRQSEMSNSLERPTLPYFQAWYRAKANSLDRLVFSSVLTRPIWIVIIGLAILAFIAASVVLDRKHSSSALLLYFTAGLVSLTLELLSFYVYQSSAGSLYSELAALIGAFMLGLAVGTYLTHRMAARGAEYFALGLLLAATLVFATTYRSVPAFILLVYHSLFLFTVAVGTGSLFVAATARYFRRGSDLNRGAGYAWELAGSALGALLPMTILLPVIGLTLLLAALVVVLCLAVAGSLLTARNS